MNFPHFNPIQLFISFHFQSNNCYFIFNFKSINFISYSYPLHLLLEYVFFTFILFFISNFLLSFIYYVRTKSKNPVINSKILINIILFFKTVFFIFKSFYIFVKYINSFHYVIFLLTQNSTFFYLFFSIFL